MLRRIRGRGVAVDREVRHAGLAAPVNGTHHPQARWVAEERESPGRFFDDEVRDDIHPRKLAGIDSSIKRLRERSTTVTACRTSEGWRPST